MRILGRLKRSSTTPGPRESAAEDRVTLGPPLQPDEIWSHELPGWSTAALVATMFDARSRSLYISDGAGLLYPHIRFRRVDLDTGEELAKARLGNNANCLAWVESTETNPGRTTADRRLLAVTDRKFFLLDPLTLHEERRLDERMPGYTHSIGVWDGFAVSANWLKPTVSVVNLATGSVRRRASGEMTQVITGASQPLLIGGALGGIRTIDPRTATPRDVGPAPPAISATVDRTEPALWLLAGRLAKVTSTSVIQTDGSDRLVRIALDGSGPTTQWRLPRKALRVIAGRNSLWLMGTHGRSGSYVLSIALPMAAGRGRVWEVDGGAGVLDVEPDEGLALTGLSSRADTSTRLTLTHLTSA